MTDQSWMEIALLEARKGIGKTAPNPPVGAAIVKGGVLLGRGWHHAAGCPHAEREAIADATINHGADAIRGSTIYVTLEPCSTMGRTPPCTQGILDAGISRVVYATVDRNPAHAGRADEILTNAGIEVVTGICRDQAERLLRPFFKVRETGLPWVIWKCAMSLDGRITRRPGEGQWLTGETARADVQLLRASVDAILTSGETVRRDLPSLTIRNPDLIIGRLQPWRIVFTNAPESLPDHAPLFCDEWKDRTLIRSGRYLEDTLRDLVREQGILTAMIEAGGLFSSSMLEAGLIDEAVIYYAPILCGGTVPALAGKGLTNSMQFKEIEYTRFDNDIRFRGVLIKKNQLTRITEKIQL